ncbi:MAG: NTP transferase domain-containing protein [Elusimicrobia bacterium]|nr:NTP transferase domain-containing protein [Elusimicrobiota bacterium]
MALSDMKLARSLLGSLSAVVLACGAGAAPADEGPRGRWGRVQLIEHVASGLSRLVDDVVVVTRGSARVPVRLGRGLRVVRDCRDAGRPMTSLAAGLAGCRHPSAFVCAFDMPLIEPDLVARLAEAAAGYEAAVPRWQGRLQPLCAVYTRRVAGVIERLVDERRPALEELFTIVPTRFLLEDEVRAVDPKGRSFCGVGAGGGRRAVKGG